MNDEPAYVTRTPIGRVGHVDHGKTALTAAITCAAASAAAQEASAEREQRLRDAAEEAGIHPDRVHFIGNAVILDDQSVPDAEYNRTERHKYLLTWHAEQSRRLENHPHHHNYTMPPPFAKEPMEYMGHRTKKSGKDKSTRRFDLPPRRL